MINNIDELIIAKNKYQSEIDIECGKRDALENSLKTIEDKIINLTEEEELLEEVVILFQHTAEYARNQAKTQIEALVTKCLQFIFETNIEFTIEFSESRNLPIAEFYVTNQYDGYSVKTKPEIARGGGVVDIVSLALRISFLEIHRPPIVGPLFLDEPGKHVSEEYIFNLGEFIKQASEMFGRQIIMVTHNSFLSQMCDKTYTIDIHNGLSEIVKEEHLK